MVKKMIVAVVMVLLIIGISSFTANAGEKKDVKTQKEEPLCYKVASMIKDVTISKYALDGVNFEPRGTNYLNLDIDGDDISDKVTVSSGTGESYLEVKLSNGGEYDLGESLMYLIRFRGHIYALVDMSSHDKKTIAFHLYILNKNNIQRICNVNNF